MSAALQRIVNAEPQSAAGLMQPFDPGLLSPGVSQSIWRATEVGSAGTAVISSGFTTLDAQLPGGGWPFNSLTELLQPQPSLCEWRLLGPALATLASTGGKVLLIGPPKRPHVPGLIKLGIPASNLVWIAADTPAERLWSTEQLIKSNPRGSAILAWLPQARSDQIRRLQVHAQSCDGPMFLFRPEAAQIEASPAPLRILATLGQHWDLQIQILKRKGSLVEGTLAIEAIPANLREVLPPRLLRLAPLPAAQDKPEVSRVITLGRTAPRRRSKQLLSQ